MNTCQCTDICGVCLSVHTLVPFPVPDEGLLEATFMECLRRCGWGVTAHQLSPPGAEFQCFCSHTFWRVWAPSTGAGPWHYLGAEDQVSGPFGGTEVIVDFQLPRLFSVARPLPSYK
eukprot:RCo015300